jgi:hypothetical protein
MQAVQQCVNRSSVQTKLRPLIAIVTLNLWSEVALDLVQLLHSSGSDVLKHTSESLCASNIALEKQIS